MRLGVDDGGILMLVHDGQSWGMLTLTGGVVYRNTDLAKDDTTGACDWAHDTVTAIADVPPPRPSHSIAGVYCYHLQERDGQVVADLSPGMVHHDGQMWVMVDALGEVTDRTADVAADDLAAALDWANEIHTSRPDYRPTPEHGITTGGRYFAYDPSADSGAA